MKKICIVVTGVALMVFGYSQAGQLQVEKQIQDPHRKANAGKADAIIANKKNIFDSTIFHDNTTDASNSKTVKASSKKNHCGKKTKQSNRAVVSKKKA